MMRVRLLLVVLLLVDIPRLLQFNLEIDASYVFASETELIEINVWLDTHTERHTELANVLCISFNSSNIRKFIIRNAHLIFIRRFCAFYYYDCFCFVQKLLFCFRFVFGV